MKIGTCGFCESHSSYYKDFDVIELQNTFYDFVNDRWLEKLRNESPKNFEFTIKGIQIITHKYNSPTYRRFKSDFGDKSNYGFFRKTEEVYKSMEIMINYANILKSNVIILQAPPNFNENVENLKNLNEFLYEFTNKNIFIGLELRGNWNKNTILNMIKKFNIIHVTDPFKEENLSLNFKYYRLHGIGGYSYKYSIDDLEKLIKITNSEDYILFNNTFMCENAKQFKNLIKLNK